MLTALLAAIVLSGCGGARTEPYDVAVAEDDANVHYEFQEFGLAPHVLQLSDEIEVSYIKDLRRLPQPYCLQPGDRLRVEIVNREDLDETCTVLPDGTITLPLLGAVPVAGKDVTTVRTELATSFSQHFDAPVVNVLIDEAAMPLVEALDALEANPSRLARRITLTEGSLRLPLVDPIPVLDRSIDDVQNALQTAYDAAVPGLRVNIGLVNTPTDSINILGEVKQATRVSTRSPLSLMEALTAAGGLTDRARTKQIIVIRMAKDRSGIRVRNFDIREDLRGDAAAAWVAMVEPGETIYVPRSTIANVNLWVDQFLRKNIPINMSVGLYVPVETL